MTRIQFLHRGLLIDAEFSPRGRDTQEAPGDDAEITHIYSVEIDIEHLVLRLLDDDEMLEAAEAAYGEVG